MLKETTFPPPDFGLQINTGRDGVHACAGASSSADRDRAVRPRATAPIISAIMVSSAGTSRRSVHTKNATPSTARITPTMRRVRRRLTVSHAPIPNSTRPTTRAKGCRGSPSHEMITTMGKRAAHTSAAIARNRGTTNLSLSVVSVIVDRNVVT